MQQRPTRSQSPTLKPLSETPLVSVIMPSFNQGPFIRRAIDSILSQSYRPLELIVMDGGSTDETVAVLQSYESVPEVRWWSEPDKGPVDAVNKALKHARGDVIGIQSSDDGYLPNAVAEAVSALTQEIGEIPALVYADVRKVDAADTWIGSSRIAARDLAAFLAKRTWVPQPAAFFRREVLEELGGWDVSIPYTPDVDLWMRIWFRYPVRKIDREWGLQRSHSGQRDCHAAKIRRDWKRMIRQSADIQKASLKLRLAAESGIHRNNARYSSGSDLMDTLHVWAAILYWPPHILDARQEWRRLLPGYLPAMKGLSWIKQNVFGLSGRKMPRTLSSAER